MRTHESTGRIRSILTAIAAIAISALALAVATRAQTALPSITLQPGEKFFRLDGTPLVMLGANPVAFQQAGSPPLTYIQGLLDWEKVNERIVRIHLTNGKRPAATTRAGEVDPLWAKFWDDAFDLAQARGLWVLPVFDVWADWSTINTGTQSWANNPYNSVKNLGGVATNPDELLQDTATRAMWLEWMRQLVARWQARPNIVGWEIFSELDLITGADASEATSFVEAAAAMIHGADTHHRPITASQAGINDWSLLSSNNALNFIQIHPYANSFGYNGNLDTLILDTVRQRLATYGKPVFIGESGLDSRTPVLSATSTTREMSLNAPVGINHAIWAGAVSGAMTARMLWFEDGYDIFTFNPFGQTTTRLDLRTKYKDASAPVAKFLSGLDYSGFEPITATLSSPITGAALGNASLIIGWVRDKLSAASTNYPTTPGWPTTAPLAGQTVTVAAPGRWHDWHVTFYDTRSGDVVGSTDTNQAPDGAITVELPSFAPSIAFQIRAVADTTPPVIDTCALSSQTTADTQYGTAAVPNLVIQIAAHDNVSLLSELMITQSPIAGVPVGPGAHAIGISVTDAAGNEATCSATFTVLDVTPPAIAACAAPRTANADGLGQAAVPDFTAEVAATDNDPAGTLHYGQSPAAGTLVGSGPHPVSITVTDEAGNQSECVTTFTVGDATPPTINACAAPQVSGSGPTGFVTVPDFRGAVAASDNVTPAMQLSVIQMPEPGTVVGASSYPVTLTIADAAGNGTSCATSFTVGDTTPPAIAACASSIAIGSGPTGLVPAPVLLGLLASDNVTPAGQLTVVATPAPGSGAFGAGGPYPVSFSVTDQAGNSSVCAATFSVADTTPPIITTCAAPQSSAPAPDGRAAVPNFASDVIAFDNVGIFSVAQSPLAGALVGAGAHLVTVRVGDAAGQSASCETALTVESANSLTQKVLADVTALRATIADAGEAKKLDRTIDHLDRSLQADFWVDGNHLDSKRGNRVFNEEKDAVIALLNLLKQKHTVADAAIQGFIGRIAQADRLLASVAIADAQGDPNTDPKQVPKGLGELAKGDQDLADGKQPSGIEDYRKGWKHMQNAD